MLELLLRSRAKVAVLGVVLFKDGLHLREIARRAGVSSYEAKRELDGLVLLGLLGEEEKGNLLIYSVKPNCPFVGELKGLYLKTEGPVPLLRKGLEKLAGLRYAFIYGSFASGNFGERSDIDLFLVGDVKPEHADGICFEVQKKTLREVNYILWNNEDFRKKAGEGGAFFSSLLKKPKIWLIGDTDGFERDAEKERNRKGRAR